MRRLKFESFDTNENKLLAEYRNSILWVLNHLNTSIMVAAQKGPESEKVQLSIFSGLILTACTTGSNVSRLLEPLSITSKDCLPLARTFYESCLQATYAMTDNGKIAERIKYYSLYKAFKLQTQHYQFGNSAGLIEHPIKIDRNDPEVAKAIGLFESRSSNKVKPCFEVNRSGMLRQIASSSLEANILLSGAERMNWDTASEIAHGSYFGFEYSSGKTLLNSQHSTVESEMSFIATATIIVCCNAVAYLAKSRFPDLDDALHLIKAAKLFYQEFIPEMNAEISMLS